MRTAPSKFWTFLIALFIGLGVWRSGRISCGRRRRGITLDKKAPGSVLLGDPIPYTLTAGNPAGNAPVQREFLRHPARGFRVRRPDRPGIGKRADSHTDLGWTDLIDLEQRHRPAARFLVHLKFSASPRRDPDDNHFRRQNTAYVAGSTNERKVPKFNSNGFTRRRSPRSSTAATPRTPTAHVRRREDEHQQPRKASCCAGSTTNGRPTHLTIRNNRAWRRPASRSPTTCTVGVPWLRQR